MPSTDSSNDCEAEERNKRALYMIQNEWGCGRIDVGEIVRLLRGDACDHENGGA
jgi:hypothetical protein